MKMLAALLFMVQPVLAQDYWDEDFEVIAKKAEGSATGQARKVLETGRIMTLDSALILPGSCWDYANAVYERAGYSWGQRDNVYKTIKAGPYADVTKIQSGDWLYYVNYSYGNIEHSAIFIDWLDVKGKIGLMLSYGGESRSEPARYLPYDLRSVYGITRPKVTTLGEKTSGEKKVAEDAKSNTKTIDEAKTFSAASVSGVESNGMKVDALKFGVHVQQMEIVGQATAFAATTGRVYCWARVSGGQGRFIRIKWYRDGNAMGESKLDIISNSMRTYSYRTVTSKPGQWFVEVVDPAGTVLHAEGFVVK